MNAKIAPFIGIDNENQGGKEMQKNAVQVGRRRKEGDGHGKSALHIT